jgi:hypothetical protein
MKPTSKFKLFLHLVARIPRSIAHVISNLVYWIPIIFNDYQWDYSSFWHVMAAKLRRMEDFYEKGVNVWCESEVRLESIKRAKTIVEIIEKEDYLEWDGIEDIGEHQKRYKQKRAELFDELADILKNKSESWWD